MESPSVPKLAEIEPELSPETYRLRESHVLGHIEETQFEINKFGGSIQSYLFVATVFVWFLKKKTDATISDIKRCGIEVKNPDFWIEKPTLIGIPYNDGRKYYLSLESMRFYGFQEADYTFKADVSFEKTIALMTDNKGKNRIRKDKMWKLELQIDAKNVTGESHFKILDERRQAHHTVFGKFTFRFKNLKINAEIQLIEIDRNFVTDNIRFSAANVDFKINYDKFSKLIQTYPTKYFPYESQREYEITTQRVIDDFILEKMNSDNGKTELSKRLSSYITDNISPVIMKMKSKMELPYAFFIANNIEPVPADIKRRFANYFA